MIDIHCHILPGMDDGPETMEESLHMVRAFMADGISEVVATPHGPIYGERSIMPSDIQQACFDLQRSLLEAGLDFMIHPGQEILLDEHTPRLLQSDRLVTLAGSDYALVEAPLFCPLPDLNDILFELRLMGYRPILAHFERAVYAAEDLSLIRKLSEEEALFQINADSLLGLHGSVAKRLAWKMLEMGTVDFVSSDAHGLTNRKSHLHQVHALLKRKVGSELAERLVLVNPHKVLLNQPIEREDGMGEMGAKRRRRFWTK